MTIKSEQVIQAIDEADNAYTLLFDAQTGETVYLPDAFVTGERDDEPERLMENNPHRYLRFPIKYEP